MQAIQGQQFTKMGRKYNYDRLYRINTCHKVGVYIVNMSMALPFGGFLQRKNPSKENHAHCPSVGYVHCGIVPTFSHVSACLLHMEKKE